MRKSYISIFTRLCKILKKDITLYQKKSLFNIALFKGDISMEAYDKFAEVYDLLMSDVNYDDWVKFIEEVFEISSIKPKNIIELACGTGNITNRMAKKGYNITGIDMSEQMLTIAKKKAHDMGLLVDYINQDMTEFNYSKKADCILCLCDGINYIIDEKKLLETFERIYATLEDRGVFIFDISSYYKLSEILGNNIFAENLEDISYIWENYFEPAESICELELTFFLRKGNLFEKFNEIHYQRAYKKNELIELLHEVNFEDIDVFSDYTFKKAEKYDERKIFICYKR